VVPSASPTAPIVLFRPRHPRSVLGGRPPCGRGAGLRCPPGLSGSISPPRPRPRAGRGGGGAAPDADLAAGRGGATCSIARRRPFWGTCWTLSGPTSTGWS
jgi:hypothetical protein